MKLIWLNESKQEQKLFRKSSTGIWGLQPSTAIILADLFLFKDDK
jgi:hypothetical protein